MVKEIILITTYSCNLRCAYCYEPKRERHEMPVDDARQIILKAMDDTDESVYDRINLQFMGGEPLMNFNLLREVSEWIWSRGWKIPFTMLSAPTNGTLLNDEMRQWFGKNRDRFRLMLSFDGTRLMQNLNRCGSAAAVDLDFFAEVYPDAGVKMTLSPMTIGYFYEGVTSLYDRGLKYVEANLAYGAGNRWQRCHLDSLRSQLDLLVSYYVEHPEATVIGLLNMPVWNILFDEAPYLRCRCGSNVVCYDYDGVEYPCHLFSPVTLPRQKALEARKLDFQKIRSDRSSACGRCILRKICTVCFGSNYLDTGDCTRQSPFDCAQFKLFFLASCKLHKLAALRDGDKKREELVNRTIEMLRKCNK